MTATQNVARAATEGRGEVDAARQEAAEAAQLVAALEERVRSGDSAVDPAELIQAREVARIATLRVEAAQRRAKQLAVAARHASYVEYGKNLDAERKELLSTEAAISSAFAKAREALSALWDLSQERSTQLARLTTARGPVLRLAQQHGETGMLPAAVAGRPDAPAAEVAALPLHGLLVDKLAEYRLSGGQRASWSPDQISLHVRRAEQVFPALAPPTVEVRLAQLRRERVAGGR